MISGATTSCKLEEKDIAIQQTCKNISQIIDSAIKTNRQINYVNQSFATGPFRNKRETPFTVGIGLSVYKKTRSKEMIDFLSHSNLSINYTCLLRIQANLANAVVERIVENDGIYVPPQLEKNKPIFYVIDNCDFQTYTPDRKNSFHGTI